MHFLVLQYAEKVFLADPQSVGGFHRDDGGRTGRLGKESHLAKRCAGFAANAKTAGEQDQQLVAGIAERVDPLGLFVAAEGADAQQAFDSRQRQAVEGV